MQLLHVPGFNLAAPLRITGVSTHEPTCPDYQQLLESWRPEHRRPDGFSVWWLEQPLACATLVGSLDAGRRYLATVQEQGYQHFPTLAELQGAVAYSDWPNLGTWPTHWPRTTWNETGEGIVAELADGVLIVFEERSGPGDDAKAVSWHCTVCHTHDVTSYVNASPSDRRQTAINAERHLREGHNQLPPDLDRRLRAALEEATGQALSVDYHAKGCQKSGRCAQLAGYRTVAVAG